MDQKRIKESKERAIKLLPKLKAAAANSEKRFTITLRYSPQQGSIEYARPALEKIYGKAYEYSFITAGDPDGMGDLEQMKEVAVRAEYFINNVIKHIESYAPKDAA